MIKIQHKLDLPAAVRQAMAVEPFLEPEGHHLADHDAIASPPVNAQPSRDAIGDAPNATI